MGVAAGAGDGLAAQRRIDVDVAVGHHLGARGDAHARILTLCLEPELVSIAGVYRTSEQPLPDKLRGKPAQIRLQGDKLVMEPLKT
jgi:septum formation inhibitor MinC